MKQKATKLTKENSRSFIVSFFSRKSARKSVVPVLLPPCCSPRAAPGCRRNNRDPEDRFSCASRFGNSYNPESAVAVEVYLR